MAVVCDRNSLDEMVGIAFCDGAVIMAWLWARTQIADTGNWNAVDHIVICTNFHYLAAVAGGVTESDDVWHNENQYVGLNIRTVARRRGLPRKVC